MSQLSVSLLGLFILNWCGYIAPCDLFDKNNKYSPLAHWKQMQELWFENQTFSTAGAFIQYILFLGWQSVVRITERVMMKYSCVVHFTYKYLFLVIYDSHVDYSCSSRPIHDRILNLRLKASSMSNNIQKLSSKCMFLVVVYYSIAILIVFVWYFFISFYWKVPVQLNRVNSFLYKIMNLIMTPAICLQVMCKC